jgi:hypothetical protein
MRAEVQKHADALNLCPLFGEVRGRRAFRCEVADDKFSGGLIVHMHWYTTDDRVCEVSRVLVGRDAPYVRRAPVSNVSIRVNLVWVQADAGGNCIISTPRGSMVVERADVEDMADALAQYLQSGANAYSTAPKETP